ncbi:retrovirus-related pol polyprotein from transposon TNT 1-94 [Tanacetum coccineum]
MSELTLVDSSFAVPVFSLGDDLIACLNKAMAFLTVVASSRFPSTNNQLRTSLNPRNHVTIQDGRVTVQQVQWRQEQSYSGTGYKSNATSSGGNNKSGCQGLLNATTANVKDIWLGNALSLSDQGMQHDPGVPDDQAVQTIILNNTAFQTKDLDTYDSDCDDISNAKAVLMANISNYGSNVISEAQQDSMILSVIEQMSEQMINHVNNWEKDNKKQNNEPVTAELQRYKKRVKTFKQRLNIDLSSREKMIDSQMDDMIKKKLALKEQVDSLEQNLFKQIKENESQWIKPTLYDGIVISAKHVAMHVIDDEEILILEEESRSKILSEDLGKHFTSQQELAAEQAFWFCISNPTNESSNKPPVKVEVPSELPKVSLVNASLKKLKFHLAQFDSVLKKRTTPDARTEELLLENDQLLQQIMSQDVLLNVMITMSLKGESVNMGRKRNESCDKCFNLDAELLKSQNAHNDILKRFKDQFDSIKKTCVRTKEQSDSLIDKLNLKSAENEDLKAQIQDKEQADILQGIVEQAKEKQPLDNELDFACKHAQRIQELLVYVRDTCPNAIKPSAKKADATPKNNVKKVRFAEPLTSSSNIKQVESSKTLDSNTPVLYPTGLKCSTSNYGSKPTGNKRNDRISQTRSRNMKNKVEAEPRKVNKKNRVVEPIRDVDVKHSLLNANSICATCKKSMFYDVHDMCLLHFVKNVNSRAKSAKKHKKQNIWKPTGHVFTEVGLKWKPTGRTFTIVGNSCPLTRITSANVAPSKKTTSHSVETQKPELKVYNRKPKNVKNISSSKKAKIVESKNSNHSKPNHTWGSNAIDIPSSSSLVMTSCPDCSLVSGLWLFETYDREPLSAHELCCKFLGTVRFRNDHIVRIMVYRDYQLGNVTISRVYYVEGLGHNLFFVGQFCDANLEVAFWKNTCFIRNLKGVDLISGSGDTNLYTISFDDMLKTSPICLLSKASKTKRWLWHRRLSHLNFGTLNKLARDGLARGIPRLKYQKDHLSKDEAPDAIIKCIKNIQVHLNATVCNVRTDNGTEFVNQTLREFYENVGISHQTSVARTPQQNGVKIIKTIHVTFDELTAMASEQLGSGPGLQFITPATSISRLVPNTVSQQPCIPPNRDDRDHLFQPMFDEYFNPPSIVVSPVLEAAALRAVVLADSPVLTSINQDGPSISYPSTQEQEHSLIISQCFKESLKTPSFRDDRLHESLNEDSTPQGSSLNVRQIHTPFEHLGKWTKDHPIENVIGDPSRSVSTRKKLQTDAMWCYFDAFLTSVEPKNFKQAMTEPS